MVICVVAVHTAEGVASFLLGRSIGLTVLYLPEVLYLVMRVVVVLAGPGPLRLDSIVLHAL